MKNSKVYAVYVAYCRYLIYRYSNQKIIKKYNQTIEQVIHQELEADLSKIDAEEQKYLRVFLCDYLIIQYALFYAVIDCYKDLGLKDKKIDGLLKDNVELINKLRGLRNTVLHPKRYHKLVKDVYDFIEHPSSAEWIGNLHNAFSNFFKTHPLIEKEFKQSEELLQLMIKSADKKIEELIE